MGGGGVLPGPCRSAEWQTGASDWFAGSEQRNASQFYWLWWSEKETTWMRFSDWHLESGVCLFSQAGVNERAGGRDECSLFLSPFPSLRTSSRDALHYGRPSPPEWRRGSYPKLWMASLNMSLVHTHASLMFFRMKLWWKPMMGSSSAFSCPTTILKMQQSGVGWWSCAVILCAIFVKGRPVSFSTIALFPWNCCPSHVRHDASICVKRQR